jgi:hypothetical protein
MRGVITTQHLVTHGHVIVSEFGWSAYLKCVLAVARAQYTHKQVTFLEIIMHL